MHRFYPMSCEANTLLKIVLYCALATTSHALYFSTQTSATRRCGSRVSHESVEPWFWQLLSLEVMRHPYSLLLLYFVAALSRIQTTTKSSPGVSVMVRFNARASGCIVVPERLYNCCALPVCHSPSSPVWLLCVVTTHVVADPGTGWCGYHAFPRTL